MTNVFVNIAGYPDGDPDEVAELAWRLQEHLRAADVGDVARVLADAPVGAKGAFVAWDQLVVTPLGGLNGLVEVIIAWMDRHSGAVVSLEIDGDSLALQEGSPETSKPLLDAFINRHRAD